MGSDDLKIISFKYDLQPKHIPLVGHLSKARTSHHHQLLDEAQDAQAAHFPLSTWIDILGEESAQAQCLKKSITISDKFCDPESRDMIYMILKKDESKQQDSPLGFIRIGSRDLYLHDSTCLRLVRSCHCVLDFYSRHPRIGVGRLLLDSVSSMHDIPASQWAFDRPSQAMLSFLEKHYSLTQPLWQYNHFVIFPSFSFQSQSKSQ